MSKLNLSFILLALLALTSCNNGKKTGAKTTKDYSKVAVDTDSESEKFSYSIGVLLATTLKNNNIDSIDYSIIDRAVNDSEENQIAYTVAASEVQRLNSEEVDLEQINEDIVKRGMYDVLDGDTTLMSVQEVGQAYENYLTNNEHRVGERNLASGKTFLENNLTQEGVKVTESGLQYQLIQEGSGGMPSKDDVVLTYYLGDVVDGGQFVDNSVEPSYVDLSDNTADFPGLAEGVRLFPYGSEFKLFVPSNLGFGGNRVSPELGPNSTLIIHVTNTEKMDAENVKKYRQAKKEYYQQMEAQRQMQMQMQQQGR